MLLKVYKHFFNKCIKVLLPIDIAVFVAAVLLSVTTLTATGSSIFGILDIFTGLIMFFSEFAVLAGLIAGAIIIFIRFCKDMCTDEAYLTYTLPIEPKDQIIGRFLAVLLLGLINFAFALAGLSFIVILQPEVASALFDGIGYLFTSIFTSGGWSITLFFEILLILLITSVVVVLLMFTVALLVGVVIKTKKALKIILMYVGFQVLIVVVTTIVISTLERASMSGASIYLAVQPLMIFAIIIETGAAIGMYFGCLYMVKNKVNLS